VAFIGLTILASRWTCYHLRSPPDFWGYGATAERSTDHPVAAYAKEIREYWLIVWGYVTYGGTPAIVHTLCSEGKVWIFREARDS
jgi:hypothetical protein